MRVLFLVLKSFSGEGGIEKFNRVFLKALNEISEGGEISLKVLSLYDKNPDIRYIDSKYFTGYYASRPRFIHNSMFQGLKSDYIILSHINLSIIGLMLKKLNSRARIIVITHGIEVWGKISYEKKLFLKYCDLILSVSNFTKVQILNSNKLDDDKIKIFPNTLDPGLNLSPDHKRPGILTSKYGITENTRILLTVSRLSSSERYKGYDKVIVVLPAILKKYPDLKYFIVGNTDSSELSRVSDLVHKLNLESVVILTGFIPGEHIYEYYQMADLFVMPSAGEGFGIVFLEALACGVPVIAGNSDGSSDALKNGKFGLLVDTFDLSAIEAAILNILDRNVDQRLTDPSFLSEGVEREFGYKKFKSNLISVLGINPKLH